MIYVFAVVTQSRHRLGPCFTELHGALTAPAWAQLRFDAALHARLLCFRIRTKGALLSWSPWVPLWLPDVCSGFRHFDVERLRDLVGQHGRDLILPPLPLLYAPDITEREMAPSPLPPCVRTLRLCSGPNGPAIPPQPSSCAYPEYRLAHSYDALDAPGTTVAMHRGGAWKGALELPSSGGHAPTLHLSLQCHIWLLNASQLPLQHSTGSCDGPALDAMKAFPNAGGPGSGTPRALATGCPALLLDQISSLDTCVESTWEHAVWVDSAGLLSSASGGWVPATAIKDGRHEWDGPFGGSIAPRTRESIILPAPESCE